MNKFWIIIGLFFVSVGCKDEVVAKPDKLIDKEVMTSILYDMALLEAIKYQYPFVVDSNEVNTAKYIYKKYKIDSTQFAQNNLYYASYYNEYKDMFTEVESRVKIKDSLVNVAIKKKEKQDSIKNKGKVKKDEKKDTVIAKKINVDSIKRSIQKNREKL